VSPEIKVKRHLKSGCAAEMSLRCQGEIVHASRVVGVGEGEEFSWDVRTLSMSDKGESKTEEVEDAAAEMAWPEEDESEEEMDLDDKLEASVGQGGGIAAEGEAKIVEKTPAVEDMVRVNGEWVLASSQEDKVEAKQKSMPPLVTLLLLIGLGVVVYLRRSFKEHIL
jgi:hypothetical protein